jgi:hypothetical protein
MSFGEKVSTVLLAIVLAIILGLISGMMTGNTYGDKVMKAFAEAELVEVNRLSNAPGNEYFQVTLRTKGKLQYASFSTPEAAARYAASLGKGK